MALTNGINHLGLAVRNLETSKNFFVKLLGWEESGYDETYPRTAVSDGVVRLTLWQVAAGAEAIGFDRKSNVGLHHLALEVESEETLYQLHKKFEQNLEVHIEFAPELVGAGPRKHMMCNEPGGIRVEFIWPGT